MFDVFVKAEPSEQEEEQSEVAPMPEPPPEPQIQTYPTTSSAKQLGSSGGKPEPGYGSPPRPSAPVRPYYTSPTEAPPSGEKPMFRSGDAPLPRRGPPGDDAGGETGRSGSGYTFSYSDRISDAQRGKDTAGPISLSITGRNLEKGDGSPKKSYKIRGFDIGIENPSGTVRRGKNKRGIPWTTTMTDDYGYFKDVPGVDGDSLDVFVGPQARNNDEFDKVWVIHAKNPDNSKYDEDKVMFGYRSREDAIASFRRHYDDPDNFMGPVNEYTVDNFKKILDAIKLNRKAKRLGRGRFAKKRPRGFKFS